MNSGTEREDVAARPAPSALIVDWGGVLTTALHVSLYAWAADDGIDPQLLHSAVLDWLEPVGVSDLPTNPVAALERGDLDVPEFERRLARRLRDVTGVPVRPEGLIGRMFAHFAYAQDMNDLVRRARSLGIRTALLSNSWGNTYPRDTWSDMFDVVVISREVGMRKPEPAMFQRMLDLLALPAGQCVFVDDLISNVEAARQLGMIGLLHTDYESTVSQLEELFAIPLREASRASAHPAPASDQQQAVDDRPDADVGDPPAASVGDPPVGSDGDPPAASDGDPPAGSDGDPPEGQVANNSVSPPTV